MDPQLDNRTRAALGAFIIAVLVASIGGAAALSAQPDSNTDCSGDSITEVNEVHLINGSVTTAVVNLNGTLPAGTYELNAASFDAHDGRETIPAQNEEQWLVEFIDADGAVLATSLPTADLEDGTASAFWSGSIGTVTLSADAVSARVVHAFPEASGANSVFPSCFGATAIASEAVTTTSVETDDSTPVTEADVIATTSSVTLDYDSDSATTSSAAVVCDLGAESDSGDSIDIVIDGIEPGTECIVAYPQNLECSVVVDPVSSAIVQRAGDLTIGLPASGPIDVLVDIDCSDELEADAPGSATTVAPAPAVTTTEAPEQAVTTTVAEAPAVTTTTVVTEVQGNTATTAAPAATTTTLSPAMESAPVAPAAQSQDATPSFTG